MKKLLVLSVGIFLLLLLVYWQSIKEHDPLPVKSTITVPTQEGTVLVDTQREAYVQSHGHIDSARLKERDGVFYLDESIRFYFEYFMLRRAELSDAVLLTAVNKDATARYGEKNAAYINDLFSRYLQYRDAADVPLDDNSSAIDSYNQQEIDLVDLRERLFNAIESKALFDDSYLKKYSYEKSSQKKIDEYYKLAEKLPPESLDALRTEMFGMEAAVRFKELELKRQRWQQKLKEYFCQRLQIDNSAGLAEVDKSKQVQQLQAQYFDNLEVKRVQALERNNALPIKAKCL